ncbi:29269_t:CDS:2, partial [Racocetra persica]
AINLQDDNENNHKLEVFLKNYIEKKKLEYEKETQRRELQILKKSKDAL